MASIDTSDNAGSVEARQPSQHAAGVDRAGLIAPAKALRLLGALSDGLAELHRVNLDDAARCRVIAAHRALLIEVASSVSDPLIDELATLGARPLHPDASVDEIKVAEAQLLGWVNGLILAEAKFGTRLVMVDSEVGAGSAPAIRLRAR